MLRTLTLLFCCGALLHAVDLSAVKAEPNLEKRSGLALDKADEAIGAARTAYEAGKIDEFKSQLNAAGELTELCYQSLQDSGKRARRNPKWFKRAEQKLILMLRRADTLATDVTVDDKAAVETLQKRLRVVHDQVLQDIMSKK